MLQSISTTVIYYINLKVENKYSWIVKDSFLHINKYLIIAFPAKYLIPSGFSSKKWLTICMSYCLQPNPYEDFMISCHVESN